MADMDLGKGEDNPLFIMSAHVESGGHNKHIVCCFDPMIVLLRLKAVFPEVEVLPQDLVWRNYNKLKQLGAPEVVLLTAENDVRRRCPYRSFRLPAGDQEKVHGHVERYHVSIQSDRPFPEPFRSRFIGFLEELRFGPWVTVESIRLEGNDEFTA